LTAALADEPTGGGVVVDDLPRRTAHALYALLCASTEQNAPPTAAEACIYDEEAPNAQGTGQALRNGHRLGLCFNTRGFWWPQPALYDLRTELEARFLRDTAREEDAA
jgi:hypothetical protein